jgi:hypothetical protein
MSPMLMLVVGVCAAGFLIAMPFVYVAVTRRDYLTVFEHRRRGQFIRHRAETMAGIMFYPGGGCVEDQAGRFSLIYGRSIHEFGPAEFRRPRRPAYMTAQGQSGYYALQADGTFTVQGITEPERLRRKKIMAALAVIDGAKRSNSYDFGARLIAVSIVIFAVCIAGLALFVAQKGAL